MKQLIRKILKEETEDYQMASKGIDAVISLAKKQYPFIVGWEKSGRWEESNYNLYINLVIDYKKVKEFYNLPLKSYYMNYPEMIEELIQKKEKHAYPTSILNVEESNMDQWEEFKKIKTVIEESYDLIPDEYKLMRVRYDLFGKPENTPKELNVDYTIFV